MRIAGWVLLLAGFVLCLSVAWAALGFLLMGIGLVSLQVAERKRGKAEKAAVVAGLDAHPETAAAAAEVSPAHAEPVALAPPPLPASEATGHADISTYDGAAWRRLVESDPDLARLAAVLADYGQHYVDEFAESYLSKPDKSRLATIVNEIVAKATRKQSAPTAEAPEVHQPSIDANQAPRSAHARTEPDRRPPKIHAPRVAVAPPAEPEIRNGATAMAPPVQVERNEIRREPSPEHGNEKITSPDDDLSELIRKFANDTSFPRR
ncbi:hypothetical protein [Bradyrhizobium cenepequi]|uniref:hypothetical protein n=1 Tax=Bradyrhizobium cenepequi TaxID=2821403 RepID=UPI001CE34F7E|nr:hypothetical protein [Bradyrhizobium cenepequi]MCA6112770.1 hypothetical protein [Bradyrhizobium cenepequi]